MMPFRVFGALGRARLSFKLILFETLLIAFVVGGAFLVLSMKIRSTTQQFFVTQLQRSQSEILNLQNRSLEQLVWTSSVITENPTLRAAIETYRLELAAGRGRRSELLGTVQREAEKIVAGLGKDLLIVTDDRGRVLAASERHGARPRGRRQPAPFAGGKPRSGLLPADRCIELRRGAGGRAVLPDRLCAHRSPGVSDRCADCRRPAGRRVPAPAAPTIRRRAS